ncbi:nucleoside phosphorylase [Roseiflexus sp.]|uniref:nucleoside phosphorylase n=1 Tax=Roseiflexus sp. TaxID=2562120 RepID=UPI0021DEA203|nr:nucleoside phosphorylase [Roseiflexus sp.]GIV98600.1 MAG: phosphorylase [Roseiflexus sp.]
MTTPTYPILEHDYASEAKLEPSRLIKPRDVPEHCVISFFREVNEKAASEQQAKVAVANRWEDGEHPLYEIEHRGRRLAFFHPGVGAPLAAGLLEEVIAFGCRKFVVVGGAGVLEKGLTVGKLILVESAVRDEGVSYHYIEPGREIQAQPQALAAIRSALKARRLPFVSGKTWTTDAPYRETQAMIDVRRAEGCLTVEMEAAALLAVAQFRKVLLGQILYAGDDLSGENWDKRGWQSRHEVRESLFWLAADACLEM